MPNWIDRYRASVSWGDQIHVDLLTPSNTVCCWVDSPEGRRYRVPGLLNAIPAAITTAQQAMRTPNCASVTVLFLDEQATAYQVEAACHALAHQGIGCGFLEPQPEVLHLGLLTRASEGTLLERMVQKLEGRD